MQAIFCTTFYSIVLQKFQQHYASPCWVLHIITEAKIAKGMVRDCRIIDDTLDFGQRRESVSSHLDEVKDADLVGGDKL